MAAVICKREVADKFAATGIEYFNTYGGNSVACAIAESVLDTIVEEGLMKNAYDVGLYTVQRLNDLKSKYPNWVGDVRGVSLSLSLSLSLSFLSLSQESDYFLVSNS